MKLTLLLASLLSVIAAVEGEYGLTSSVDTMLGEDQLLLDSDITHRHRLQRHRNHHVHRNQLEEDIDNPPPLMIQDHHEHTTVYSRNLTSSDNANCGNGKCGISETANGCPADCRNLELQASPAGTRGASGAMFMIKALRDIGIIKLDFYSGTRSTNENVQVYSRSGSYSGYEVDDDGWEKVYDDSINLLGGKTPTSISLDQRGITVESQTSRSFFIWIPNNKIRYDIGTSEDKEFSRSREVIFYEGVGVDDKFSGGGSVHSPRVFRGAIGYNAINLNTKDPLSSGSVPISKRVSCFSSQRRVKIEIKTDSYGYETSWSFFQKGKRNDPVYLGPEDRNYDSKTVYKGTFCVDTGMYVFQIKDLFSDGLCCNSGNGYYSLDVENEDGTWRKAVRGDKFGSSKEHVIDVGQTESKMTERDKAYLVAHNKRRMEWHARYNKEYVPLKWSTGLYQSSLEYAIELLDTCQMGPPVHAKNNPYGENLARNKGTGGWGQLYDPDQIVGRFVEREEGLPWARNGHLTNALWRATRYVGCAEANTSYVVKNKAGNKVTHNCRAQVCRYTKPGNCSMGQYKLDDGTIDWETPMIADDSPCGDPCPPEGCFE